MVVISNFGLWEHQTGSLCGSWSQWLECCTVNIGKFRETQISISRFVFLETTHSIKQSVPSDITLHGVLNRLLSKSTWFSQFPNVSVSLCWSMNLAPLNLLEVLHWASKFSPSSDLMTWSPPSMAWAWERKQRNKHKEIIIMINIFWVACAINADDNGSPSDFFVHLQQLSFRCRNNKRFVESFSPHNVPFMHVLLLLLVNTFNCWFYLPLPALCGCL